MLFGHVTQCMEIQSNLIQVTKLDHLQIYFLKFKSFFQEHFILGYFQHKYHYAIYNHDDHHNFPLKKLMYILHIGNHLHSHSLFP